MGMGLPAAVPSWREGEGLSMRLVASKYWFVASKIGTVVYWTGFKYSLDITDCYPP